MSSADSAPQNALGFSAIKLGLVAVVACVAAFAVGGSYGHNQSACHPADRQIEIINTLFCIPKSTGYEVRSVDQDSIKFEEVRWVSGKRVSLDQFKAHRRLNKNGNDVSVAVITYLIANSSGRQLALEQAVRSAVVAHQQHFLQALPVSFDLRSSCGRQIFQFIPASDGVFVAAVDAEDTLFCAAKEHWVVGANYSSVDVLLRCTQSRDAEFACSGSFEAGNARALVGVFGKSARHLVAAYRENRSLVLSFLSN